MFSWCYLPGVPSVPQLSANHHNPNKTASNSSTPAQLQSPSKGNCRKRVTFEHISQCNEDSGRAEWASMIVFSKGDILSVLPPLCKRTGPFQHGTGERWDGMRSGMHRKKAHHTWLYPLWDGDWLCACSWWGGICNTMGTVNALMAELHSRD